MTTRARARRSGGRSTCSSTRRRWTGCSASPAGTPAGPPPDSSPSDNALHATNGVVRQNEPPAAHFVAQVGGGSGSPRCDRSYDHSAPSRQSPSRRQSAAGTDGSPAALPSALASSARMSQLADQSGLPAASPVLRADESAALDPRKGPQSASSKPMANAASRSCREYARKAM